VSLNLRQLEDELDWQENVAKSPVRCRAWQIAFSIAMLAGLLWIVCRCFKEISL
jgi:hypothetical protein